MTCSPNSIGDVFLMRDNLRVSSEIAIIGFYMLMH